MAAIGRTFRFPLDVELSPTPTLNTETNSALFQYLRDVSTDSTFALSILQVLIDDRRTSHRLRHNEGKSPSSLKVGDVVKAHVQVQSNAERGIVGKLAYRARGPFLITKDLGGGSFHVQLYGDSSAPLRKYKNTELYLLPPVMFPSEVLDTVDQRFLDYEHAPVVSPLLKPMQIELYNDKWLQPHHKVVKTKSTTVNRPSMEIDAIAFESHPIPIIPTMEVLNKEYNTPHATSEINTDPETTLAQNTLHSQIERSVDKLLFIQYTPAGTMRRRWYLVQVDLDASKSICSTYIKDLAYYCHFLAKHPSDKNKSDEYSRW